MTDGDETAYNTFMADYSHTRARALSQVAAAQRSRRLEERASWVAEHGSHTLRVFLKAGKRCQRRYVTERAAHEHPGCFVDFDQAFSRQARGWFASEAALALEALHPGSSICWLVLDPDDPDGPDDPDDPREEGEAVVLTGYLGRYTLIWYVEQKEGC